LTILQNTAHPCAEISFAGKVFDNFHLKTLPCSFAEAASTKEPVAIKDSATNIKTKHSFPQNPVIFLVVILNSSF
jgi:hypothetical protein